MKTLTVVTIFALQLVACSSDTHSKSSSAESDTDLVRDDAGNAVSNAATNPCQRPNWTSTTMTWEELRYDGTPDGGFTVCHPEEWSVVGRSNQIRVEIPDEGFLTLSGEFRLDHADALERVTQELTGCGGRFDHDASAVMIDGWPAGQLSYRYEGPACGECDNNSIPQYFHTVVTTIAAGLFVVRIGSDLSTPASASTMDTLRAVGRSATIENPGVDAVDSDAELAQLQASAPTCD